MKPARALLLVGSAKVAAASTSASLGRYLFARLEARGVETKTMTVSRAVDGHDAALLAAVDASDLIVISTPLYVDSLPALVIRAMETIASARSHGPVWPCPLAVIVNCGFPEAAQCDPALGITRIFARRAGFEWAGGLALGEGGAIDGRTLEDLGRLGRHVRAALDLAAAALADGRRIPAEAIARMARPMMPPRVYTAIGNFGWRRQASHNGVRSRLAARPFE